MPPTEFLSRTRRRLPIQHDVTAVHPCAFEISIFFITPLIVVFSCIQSSSSALSAWPRAPRRCVGLWLGLNHKNILHAAFYFGIHTPYFFIRSPSIIRIRSILGSGLGGIIISRFLVTLDGTVVFLRPLYNKFKFVIKQVVDKRSFSLPLHVYDVNLWILGTRRRRRVQCDTYWSLYLRPWRW